MHALSALGSSHDALRSVICSNVCMQVSQAEPESVCSVTEGSQLVFDLHISAVCDYVNFSCSTNTIHFKDTMVFQTRIHQ